MSPSLTDSRRAEIESEANKLTKVYSEPPIPVYEIARENGVEVYTANFEEVADTFSGFCDFRNDNIYLNQDDTPVRQFFTAAHELGHWVLHKELYLANPKEYAFMPKRRAIAGDSSDNPKEEEADYFASCLLMPHPLVKEFQTHFSTTELAGMFNVPRALMEKRLRGGL